MRDKEGAAPAPQCVPAGVEHRRLRTGGKETKRSQLMHLPNAVGNIAGVYSWSRTRRAADRSSFTWREPDAVCSGGRFPATPQPLAVPVAVPPLRLLARRGGGSFPAGMRARSAPRQMEVI
ncbi:unnamed protein product [Pleuronectes platessa]|uniref:Uncharacterized protein n=1 Tax=Pleuronectes platessa TaxID=8262 RepID=A0A9N7VHN4_PLEPL|nr:unnamed protein product [Pleuronectes platessa]